jgi:hypothetical protein
LGLFYFEEDFFMKKFFYGVIALASVSLFLVECSTEAGEDGRPGDPVRSGSTVNETTVSAQYLSTLYLTSDDVVLGPDVETVTGTVPVNKNSLCREPRPGLAVTILP